MREGFNAFIATWFGSGNAPIAPGTFGSLAALPVGYIIHTAYGGVILGLAAMITFVAGIWIADMYMQMHNRTDDPKEVVIDEVAGQWLLLAFVQPAWLDYLIAFALFRFFDIIKPWPISWLDKKLHNGFGVMIDDMVAAIMGIIVFLFGQWALMNVI